MIDGQWYDWLVRSGRAECRSGAEAEAATPKSITLKSDTLLLLSPFTTTNYQQSWSLLQ